MFMLVEMIFELTDRNKLREFFSEVVTFKSEDVIHSHFYDDKNDCDLEYGEIDDFCSFALENRTSSSLLLNSVNCGIEMRKGGILVSHDSSGVEVSLDVDKCDFDTSLDSCIDLIRHLFTSISSGIVDNVIIGYDPAKDDDMRIVSLTKKNAHFSYFEAKKLHRGLMAN